MKSFRFKLLALAGGTAALAGSLWALQGHDTNYDFPVIMFDHPAIQYTERAPNDPVARLQKRIDAGEVKLDYRPQWGYLPDILKALDINVDSQIMVFSKTSSQVDRISTAAPRAIYFNDSVAVGFLQGTRVLELSAIDPVLGATFYLFTNSPPEPGKPEYTAFSQQFMNCLQCHMSPATLNVPGIIISTVSPPDESSPFSRARGFATDHRIPLKDRWGGWYVTGTHGKIRHKGNAPVDYDPQQKEPAETQNRTSHADMFDASSYLAPTSDIVALTTIEHQTRATNLILRLGWETRVALHDGKMKQYESVMRETIEELVTYLLFADEEPFPDPIAGVSSFTKTFAARGPRDKQGRSLRDFDLQRRLFKYPLSYMIYSEAFDALPPAAREAVYKRLFEVLTSPVAAAAAKPDAEEQEDTFAVLSAADRRAVLEILRDTKPNLPAYWKNYKATQ